MHTKPCRLGWDAALSRTAPIHMSSTSVDWDLSSSISAARAFRCSCLRSSEAVSLDDAMDAIEVVLCIAPWCEGSVCDRNKCSRRELVLAAWSCKKASAVAASDARYDGFFGSTTSSAPLSAPVPLAGVRAAGDMLWLTGSSDTERMNDSSPVIKRCPSSCDGS